MKKLIDKIKKWLNEIVREERHDCPYCKIELTCYGSVPWGRFTYECPKCKYKEPEEVSI